MLAQFAARQPKRAASAWLWQLAAAAILILCFVLAPVLQKSASHDLAPADVASSTISDEARAEGFIEVPYAPPLAPGEMVRVFHTELQPAALASMGVSVDPAWNTELPADLLVGEDGFPRAVRVSDENSSEGGF